MPPQALPLPPQALLLPPQALPSYPKNPQPPPLSLIFSARFIYLHYFILKKPT
jgi:hypothetical protein